MNQANTNELMDSEQLILSIDYRSDEPVICEECKRTIPATAEVTGIILEQGRSWAIPAHYTFCKGCAPTFERNWARTAHACGLVVILHHIYAGTTVEQDTAYMAVQANRSPFTCVWNEVAA